MARFLAVGLRRLGIRGLATGVTAAGDTGSGRGVTPAGVTGSGRGVTAAGDILFTVSNVATSLDCALCVEHEGAWQRPALSFPEG